MARLRNHTCKVDLPLVNFRAGELENEKWKLFAGEKTDLTQYYCSCRLFVK